MVLAIAECLLFVVMWGQSRYFRRHFRVEFAQERWVVRREGKAVCTIRTQYDGKLPLGRYRLRLIAEYAGKRRMKSPYIYGSGEGELAIPLAPSHLGWLEVWVWRTEVFDYLALFPVRISYRERAYMAVLPPRRQMHVQKILDTGMYAGEGEERRLTLGGGEEIRQLREYAAGDPYRLIHWNQTARTDVLWVKEYEPESEQSVVIYLDFFRHSSKQDIPLDAFSARGEEYVAEVTDVSAHAWPEIYLENYGWVPVEVTPSSYEAAETAYLGLDMEALQDSLESVQWDLSALTQQTVEEPEEREELNGSRLSLPESEEIWRIVTYLVLFILAYGVLERGCRTWVVGGMSARALYDRWQQTLYLWPGGIVAPVEALRVSVHQDVGIIF